MSSNNSHIDSSAVLSTSRRADSETITREAAVIVGIKGCNQEVCSCIVTARPSLESTSLPNVVRYSLKMKETCRFYALKWNTIRNGFEVSLTVTVLPAKAGVSPNFGLRTGALRYCTIERMNARIDGSFVLMQKDSSSCAYAISDKDTMRYQNTQM